MTIRVLMRRVALLGAVAGVLWLAVVGILWKGTHDIAPSIHVRWKPRTTVAGREDAERTLGLARAEFLGEHTWAYDLLDSTSENIERIVKHRLVEDTQDLDRQRFVLGPNTQLGTTRRWIGDRLPILRSRSLVENVSRIAGALVALGLLGLWTSRRGPKASAR
ncbi:MAG: hypothetical protein AB1806_18030 [Acidobacteriota bacterium]